MIDAASSDMPGAVHGELGVNGIDMNRGRGHRKISKRNCNNMASINFKGNFTSWPRVEQ